jgi:hypothetical protein
VQPEEGVPVTENVLLVLAALAVLQFKHFVCDFVIQTPYQALNKGTYGHPGGFIHAGLHALTGTLVFLVIAPPLAWGVAIVAGEFVLHYHIDWSKEQILKRMEWKHPSPPYWWTLGFDQFLHQLTYVGIVAVLATVRGL